MRKVSTQELHNFMVIVTLLDEFGFGSHSYKKMQWHCDICDLNVSRKEGSGLDFVTYYRRVALHYNYLHKNEVTMVQMAYM